MNYRLLKSSLDACLITILFLACSPGNNSFAQAGGVSINKNNALADPSAVLDVSSTSAPYAGMLIPRMTTANRNSIIAPAVGLQIFNTDCGFNEYYTGSCWISSGQNLKTPDPIVCSGTTDFCAGETRTLTVPVVNGATTYLWTVPSGATITSGQGTSAIIVEFGNNSGLVCATASNACETSPNRCIDIHIKPVPPTPGNITGPTTVAPGSSANYFIAAVTGAGLYNWTVPAGATITSGVGTPNITVNFSCSAVSGNISVTAQSNCGNSPANTLGVTVSPLTANAGPSVLTPGSLGGSPTASGGAGSYTYAWLPSTDLSSTTVANPTSSVCLLTTYTVTVTDANGCTASSSTTASSANQAQPASTFTPTTGTRSSPVTFTPTTTSGVTWSWTFTGGSPPASTSQNPSVTWSSTGTYNVSLTVTLTSTGCSSTTTNQVVIYAPPTSCQDILTANPGAPSGVYTINPGSGSTQVYCDMTTDGGGWMLVFRGAPNQGMQYNDSRWSSGADYQLSDCLNPSSSNACMNGQVYSNTPVQQFRTIDQSTGGKYINTSYNSSSPFLTVIGDGTQRIVSGMNTSNWNTALGFAIANYCSGGTVTCGFNAAVGGYCGGGGYTSYVRCGCATNGLNNTGFGSSYSVSGSPSSANNCNSNSGFSRCGNGTSDARDVVGTMWVK